MTKRKKLEELQCKKTSAMEQFKNAEKQLSTVKDNLKETRLKLETTTKD